MGLTPILLAQLQPCQLNNHSDTSPASVSISPPLNTTSTSVSAVLPIAHKHHYNPINTTLFVRQLTSLALLQECSTVSKQEELQPHTERSGTRFHWAGLDHAAGPSRCMSGSCCRFQPRRISTTGGRATASRPRPGGQVWITPPLPADRRASS